LWGFAPRRARFETCSLSLSGSFGKEAFVRAILENVAGVDVHKEMLALTVLRAKSDGSTECIQFEAKTFTEDLVACGAKLLELGVKHVAMESTGVYWKPIHNVWSPMGIELTVA
jgi:transposase